MTFKQYAVRSAVFGAAALMLAGTIVVSAAGHLPVGAADETGEAAVYLLGDVDQDGAITINDVTCIQRKLAAYPDNCDFSKLAADTNGSGAVDISDATNVQMWLARLETPYSIGEWLTVPTVPTTPPSTGEQTTESPTDEDGWGREIFRP